MIALSSDRTVAEVYEVGAYLASLRVEGVDVILPGSPQAPTKAGMAFLAPFANRVKGAEYVFDGVTYRLPRNVEGNAIHGLVLSAEFEPEEMTGDSVTLSYRLRHEGYPSELLIKVTYSVSGASLTADASLTNVGSRRAPLVVGWHPYFIVPGRWMLIADNIKKCEAVDKIPTGRLVDYEFGEDGSYDDCFLVPSGSVTLNAQDRKIMITSRDMRYFQVYTGVPGAIAVEPMSGAPDAYHNGMGLIVLEPGASASFSFTVTTKMK